MLHFPQFEIDEPRRELRAIGGRVLPLQPRVFDLLVYLAHHRERVVAKEELLDAVWPDVTVADGSLQRAVSVLRSTLETVGAADAIRTFPRRGYRLCVEPADADEGKGGDLTKLSADRLQTWAVEVQSNGRDEAAIGRLEQAATAWTGQGEALRAGWAAILLAQIRMEWGDLALGRGWAHRARRLLEGAAPGREHGYLDLLEAKIAMAVNDMETAIPLAERARACGLQTGDPDLESLALITLGEAKLFSDHVPEGLAALEEAGAAVCAGGLSPWAGGLVYCGLIYTCMTRSDWGRASEWTEQFTRWGAGKGPVSYPGLCRLHRGEILTVRGELALAEQELLAAREELEFRAPWAAGEAWRAQGETLLAKGDTAGARAHFTRAMELGWDAQFELAQVRLVEGHPAAAAELLASALAENAWSCRTRRGRALAHLVIAAARADQRKLARRALADLEDAAALGATPAVEALVLLARADLAAAEGKGDAAIPLLRDAVRTWLRMGAPLAAAQARCRLAILLEAGGQKELAAIERAAARSCFAHAGALAAYRCHAKLGA